jgi:hypothetical protein
LRVRELAKVAGGALRVSSCSLTIPVSNQRIFVSAGWIYRQTSLYVAARGVGDSLGHKQKHRWVAALQRRFEWAL